MKSIRSWLVLRWFQRSFFEQQLLDYYTNRKNLTIKVDGKKYKVQDDSFYMHGCQLYQEELDERDSLHRVRLSCREISSTPEKILYDLVASDKVAVYSVLLRLQVNL